MSNAIWTITAGTITKSPAEWGLEIVGGEFRSGSASSVTLRAAVAFDSEPVFASDSDVVILRNSSPFFRGKVRAVPRSADDSDEAQEFVVEDAWADLERTTYQEDWAAGVGSLLLPFAVLGIDSAGDRIDVGAQIAEIINFAAGNGVSITAGSVPTGMNLWPSQVTGITCAEAIRTSLRLHPDWIPWLDHTTDPPTFNVTPRASATSVGVPVTACKNIRIAEITDRIPDVVRLVFLTATVIDGEIYRDGVIQKFPTSGADAGPGVLTTVIELAGGQMQIQKQQVQTRDIPTSQETAKEFLKEKYPQIANVPDTAFDVTKWVRTAMAENEALLPDPVNPEAPRKSSSSLADLPRELVRGTVHEWMQKKVGKVRIEFKVRIRSTATLEERELLEKLPPATSMVATNAITKIYKGVSQWTPPESAPEGIAQKYYETIAAGCRFQGSIHVGGDVGDITFPGRKLNISEGLDTWAAMNAPIHAVSWDLSTGQTSVSFGPNADYSPQDFIEYLRLLAARPVNWWSKDERGSNKLGAEKKPSAKGDTCTSFDRPETSPEFQGKGRGSPFSERYLHNVEGQLKLVLWPGWVLDMGTSDLPAVTLYMPLAGTAGSEVAMDSNPPPELAVEADDFIYLSYKTDNRGYITETPKIKISAAGDEVSDHYQPPDPDGGGGLPGDYMVKLGQVVGDGDAAVFVPFINSDVFHYHELWHGSNLGDGAAIYKQRSPTADSYQFRKIKGRFGTKETQDADTVQIDLDARSIGGGVNVYKAPEVEEGDPLPDQSADFRSLRELTSGEAAAEGISPQLQVKLADGDGSDAGANDTILVRGNAKKGSLIFTETEGTTTTELGRIDWQDGMVITTGDTTIDISGANGDSFNLENWPCSQDMMSPPSSPNWVIYFRKGLAYLTDPEDDVTTKKIMYDGFSCAPPDGP